MLQSQNARVGHNLASKPPPPQNRQNEIRKWNKTNKKMYGKLKDLPFPWGNS